MKKLMLVVSVIAMAAAANAGCTWSWWMGDSKSKDDSHGCSLGLGVERQTVTGAEVGLLAAKAEKVRSGVIGAIGYCGAGKLANGAQVAFVNTADSAALQFGLLCFNKTGFLPFFVFFNFDKHMFGSAARDK